MTNWQGRVELNITAIAQNLVSRRAGFLRCTTTNEGNGGRSTHQVYGVPKREAAAEVISWARAFQSLERESRAGNSVPLNAARWRPKPAFLLTACGVGTLVLDHETATSGHAVA